MTHLTTQDLILAAVAVHLLASLSRAVFKRPAQQAQINAIEQKLDDALATVTRVLPLVQKVYSQTAAPAPSMPSLILNPLLSDAPLGVSALTKDGA